jgi:hypothetical protein
MTPHRSSTSAPHALSEVTGGILRVRYLAPLLTAAIAVSGMALITTASPAAAASSCYASSCNHKNPYKTTCWKDNSVVAVTAKDTNGDVAKLHYSPSCRAVWAEAWDVKKNSTIGVFRDDTDYTPWSQDTANYGRHTWTGMINDKGFKAFARICTPAGSSNPSCAYSKSY